MQDASSGDKIIRRLTTPPIGSVGRSVSRGNVMQALQIAEGTLQLETLI
jgi:hypothetical protein